MNIKKEARELARQVMNTADRRGYGLGECGYYFEVYSWNTMQDHNNDALNYDIDNGESINWSERKRLQEEKPELYREWRELVRKGEEIAETLEEIGINRF